ncbi:hypothetical protein KFK09_017123 [Dendrobium nobile]|uniref:Uncharacterized protein n=1 Tax=Dendrobium nobile TaxID=94219 RepID=A0A8T3B046_DENNO|nr:hypothetical protein KFK09_017123 [Dendrobium nobile]
MREHFGSKDPSSTTIAKHLLSIFIEAALVVNLNCALLVAKMKQVSCDGFKHGANGEPVVVRGVLDENSQLSWETKAMWQNICKSKISSESIQLQTIDCLAFCKVNFLMYFAGVWPTEEQKCAIEKLKKLHRDQDEREQFNSFHSKETGSRMGEIYADGFLEQRNENDQDDQIHDGGEHKRKFKEEFGIEPWTFVQELGEAVFSCTKVALDFVSPENVRECLHLTGNFRLLPKQHKQRNQKRIYFDKTDEIFS